MFILNCQLETKAFYVVDEKKQYVVGRKGCDFLILNDSSISKRHATITLKESVLKIVDIGSKYNTFVNQIKLEVFKPVTLKDGDTIKFGIRESIYKIEERKLIVLCSGLVSASKKKVLEIVKSLGGTLHTTWSSKVTYLTVDKIVLTIKVLHAIIEGLPIVSLEFWEELVKRMKDNQPPPLEKNYLPKSTDFVQKNIPFNYNPDRKTLFKNKIFVFKAKSSLEEIIVASGGKCILFSDKEITKEKLEGYNPQYLVIQEENYNSNSAHPFHKLIASLSTIKKRAIPHPEIALAIVMCSCVTNCNPDFDRVGNLLKGASQILIPSQPLVAESEPMETQNRTATSTNAVPDSYENEPMITPKIPEVIKETQKVEVIEIEDDVQEVLNRAAVEPSVLKSKSNEGGTKRISNANILEREAKRQKIDAEKQTAEENSSWIRPSTSKSKDSKVTDFFATSMPKEPQRNETVFNKPSLSQISKRKSSETEDEKPGKRLRMLKNPFSIEGIGITRSKGAVDNSDSLTVKQQGSVNTAIKTEESTPQRTLRPLLNRVEKETPWRSINDVADIKVKEEPTDAMGLLMESFRDCIIVQKEPLIVKKNYKALGYDNLDSTTGKPKNFKKFKKVQPLHMQTTIVTSFVQIICGKTNGAEVGYRNDDVEFEE